MKSSLSLLFIFVLFGSLSAQRYTVSGRVIDADSRVSIPFVNIIVNNGKWGGTTDIDGKFSIYSPEKVNSLKLTYVGYEPLNYTIDNKTKNLVIKLKEKEYELPEFVVYPTENPAHRIIQNAIENRDLNNPEKLEKFSYTSYDKMIFTIELDSLPMMDTISVDSIDQETRDFFEDHHLFMMESVSERKFMAPDHNYEEVIATKIAGLKDPILLFLLSQWQSTSFYDDRISIMDKNFINPISRGSTNKYFFLLQDTLYSGENDTTFIISYRPLLKTNFDGLEGVISINTNKWAIQNVKAEPAGKKGVITLRIQQQYEFIESKQWFPTQLNTEVIITQMAVGDSTVAITMGEIKDTANVEMVSIPIGIGKSYIKDINLNPDIRKRDFGAIEVDVDPDAGYRDEDYWIKYRIDSLTNKELNTYDFMDSVGKEIHMDRMIKTMEGLMTGKLRWGHVDLDLYRFLGYNANEGFTMGLGLHTNERVSKVFTVGGYFRYGFKDKIIKYGGDLGVSINRNWNLVWKLAYMDDKLETSGVHFWDEKSHLLSPENFRDFHIKRMDKAIVANTAVEFRTFKYLNVHVGFATVDKTATTDYMFVEQGPNDETTMSNHFNFTDFTLGLRYAYGEKFVRNIRQQVSLGTDWPIVWVQYTRGLQDVLDGEFEYNRYDVKIEKSFYTNYIGETNIKLVGGYIDSDIPYTNLFNGNGAYREFTIYAPNSFGTMRMNEFLSNKYVAMYFVHDFGKLLGTGKKFKPEFAVATNVAFGWLDYTESHVNVNYQTMEKGYYESGLLINNLLDLGVYSVGLGALYRYGPYTFNKGWDNVGSKLTIKFKF